MAAGTVIVLNGPSGCGKSTTQKHIQGLAKEPYVSLGIDNLFDMVLPDSLNLGTTPTGGFTERELRYITQEQKDGHPSITLHVGAIGTRVISGMHRAIAAYALAGNNVVVDYILYDLAWLADLATALQPCRAYFVGFEISLAELERRELARGTSPVGHARSHYDTVHGPRTYDLTVDVSALPPPAVARAILDHVVAHPEPTAFSRLRERS